MSKEQRLEMQLIAKNIPRAGTLDYVCAWFMKAANYIQETNISVSFVSTNSITQGEQAVILWIFLFEQCGIELFFAHQTFKWTNEARGRAAVYCIITGFSTEKREKKRIFSYPDIRKEATETVVTDINQYLMSSPSILIEPRRRPLSGTPPMLYGSKPVDGGYYLFTYEQKEEFIKKEPLSEKYFKKWVGASELVNSTHRYLG